MIAIGAMIVWLDAVPTDEPTIYLVPYIKNSIRPKKFNPRIYVDKVVVCKSENPVSNTVLNSLDQGIKNYSETL